MNSVKLETWGILMCCWKADRFELLNLSSPAKRETKDTLQTISTAAPCCFGPDRVKSWKSWILSPIRRIRSVVADDFSETYLFLEIRSLRTVQFKLASQTGKKEDTHTPRDHFHSCSLLHWARQGRGLDELRRVKSWKLLGKLDTAVLIFPSETCGFAFFFLGFCPASSSINCSFLL